MSGRPFTVLLADERTLPSLNRFQFLFQPFVQDGQISFCRWNETGVDIETSAPDLYRIIQGRKNWNAAVIVQPLAEGVNPFDAAGKGSEYPVYEESPIPAIQLSHMLAGLPPLGIKDFEKRYYREGVTAEQDKIVTAGDLGEDADSKTKNMRLTYVSTEYSDDEKKKYMELAERYRFTGQQPGRVFLFTIRRRQDEDKNRELTERWLDYAEAESSDIWRRNRYPTACRFLCFDAGKPNDELLDKGMFQYWLSILTASVNNIPNDDMQGRRLYSIKAELDKTILQAS